jgi:hypothetical protein
MARRLKYYEVASSCAGSSRIVGRGTPMRVSAGCLRPPSAGSRARRLRPEDVDEFRERFDGPGTAVSTGPPGAAGIVTKALLTPRRPRGCDSCSVASTPPGGGHLPKLGVAAGEGWCHHGAAPLEPLAQLVTEAA